MGAHSLYRCVTVILLVVTLQACSSIQQISQGAPTETRTPSPTATPSPTSTPTPSRTPWPTLTPNLVATQNYDDLFSDVEKFRYDNIIPSVTGRYVELENFEEDFAQIGHLQRQISYHYIEDDFVLKARIEWNTAIETSDPSGCGLIFAAERRKGKDHEYVVVLDRSRIYFGELHVAGYYELGKSRGTGRLNIGNPASAEFTLLVYDYKAYVYVDGEFIGEYALSKDHKIKGRMGYVIFSGTNRDYGTHCKISNAGMWIFEK